MLTHLHKQLVLVDEVTHFYHKPCPRCTNRCLRLLSLDSALAKHQRTMPSALRLLHLPLSGPLAHQDKLILELRKLDTPSLAVADAAYSPAISHHPNQSNPGFHAKLPVNAAKRQGLNISTHWKTHIAPDASIAKFGQVGSASQPR